MVDVKIIDMKGGMDYPFSIRAQADFADDHASALIMLSSAAQEMESRKITFAQLADFERLPLNNLDDYNRRHPEHKLPRIVIIADELADLTETYAGMDKPSKERAATIVNLLERLARKGRALGITVICCLQRPDASALPGSIKNNLNFIVAGKSQPVLSQILLGNNDAWDKILPDERGLFVTQDGTLFRGYLPRPDTFDTPVSKPDKPDANASKSDEPKGDTADTGEGGEPIGPSTP